MPPLDPRIGKSLRLPPLGPYSLGLPIWTKQANITLVYADNTKQTFWAQNSISSVIVIYDQKLTRFPNFKFRAFLDLVFYRAIGHMVVRGRPPSTTGGSNNVANCSESWRLRNIQSLPRST